MHADGRGIATISVRHDAVLEVWYSDLALGEMPAGSMAVQAGQVGQAGLVGPDGQPDGQAKRFVRLELTETRVDLDAPPDGAADAYLRLHLLSARLVRPHELNMDGIFGQLGLVAWTDLGAVHPADLAEVRASRRLAGLPLTVHAVDKFPRMTDFVCPPGVRIADASRVRLGAYLAEGTVVMHTGFVNFNAGTLGPCMVEGRITAGTIVDADTDLGAGSSIMGTLSGGGTNITRIGKRCLLGANSGTGISLGDDCAVEAGLYVTRGTLVTLPDGEVVKAVELSGMPGILFRRHSVHGNVEAVPWKSGTFTGLNPELHR
jgi:2,3,4,5-tetrahydropyridine-2,6-dicarboxylate N-succinyltransferase